MSPFSWNCPSVAGETQLPDFVTNHLCRTQRRSSLRLSESAARNAGFVIVIYIATESNSMLICSRVIDAQPEAIRTGNHMTHAHAPSSMVPPTVTQQESNVPAAVSCAKGIMNAFYV